jgi:hypothetical protein
MMKTMVNNDIAFTGTAYSAAISGSKRPPSQGVDPWLLAKKTGPGR